MKNRLRYGIFCFILGFSGACESVADKMRVVEKSRQVKPVWLDSGSGFKSSADGIDYVLCKDQVLDLTLGLVQAQTSVLYNLKFQVDRSLLKGVNVSNLSQSSAADLNKAISRILDQQLTAANLKDFYYDKVNLPLAETGLIPEYYRVFAYAHVDNTQRDAILAAVKAYMKSHPNGDLRSQSETLSQF